MDINLQHSEYINLIPTTFHKCLKHCDNGVDDDVVVVDVVAVNLMGVPTLARKMLTIWFELPPSFSTHPFILTITPSHPLSPQFSGLVQYFI